MTIVLSRRPATPLLACTLLLLLFGCRSRPTMTTFSPQDSIAVVQNIAKHRMLVDDTFQHDPESPFNRDTTVRFHGINWYPVNLEYFFRSRLYKYDTAEPVTILGTKGEQRHQLKYGYFLIPWRGKEYKLNVYKNADEPNNSRLNRELSIWFTDATTGKETYGVGRYLDVGGEAADANHLYDLDFNKCYNPYCAYSPLYSCAVPRQEDHLDFPLLAGEKKYHE